MFVKDILLTKGTDVHSIGPDATADEAVHELVRHNVGSLVVYAFEGGRRCMVGIITERDILRAQDAHRAPLERLLVHAVMSTQVVTSTAHVPLTDAMRVMTESRIRHLPILDDEREVVGIISIGDIVKAHHDELAAENHCMRSYIQGEAADIGMR